MTDHICPVESGIPVDPSSSGALSSKGITTMRNVVNHEFIVPSLFSKTHWVRRRLTNAEILSTLDSPVQITKAINDKKVDIKCFQKEEVVKTLIPLKTIQEATRILFGFSIPKEEKHVIPIYDVNRLAPEVLGLQDIYSEIDQAKAARADDSTIDTSLWDDQAAHYSGSKFPEDFNFKVINTDHRHLKGDKEALFSALRTISHHRYRKNTRKSFNRYMKTTHGHEVFGSALDGGMDDLIKGINILLQSRDAKTDLSEGLQAMSKANASSFWDWDDGSFPYFWRWQPEIKRDLRDGTPEDLGASSPP